MKGKAAFAVAALSLLTAPPSFAQTWSTCQTAATVSETGDYVLAVEIFDRCLDTVDLAPSYRARALTARGASHHFNGDYDLAIADYEEALGLDPSLALAFRNRAIAYHAKGAYDRALADFGRSLSIDPSAFQTFAGKGFTYLTMQQYDLAIALFDQALRLNPNSHRALTGRGYTRYHKGEVEQAIADFEQALRVSRGDPEVFLSRGQLFFLLGRFGQAAEDLARSVELDGDDSFAALELYVAQARDQWPNALDDLRRQAKTLDLDDWPGPIVRLYLGEIDTQALLDSIDAKGPIEERTRWTEALFHVGQKALLEGDTLSARQCFELVRALAALDNWEYEAARVELLRLGG